MSTTLSYNDFSTQFHTKSQISNIIVPLNLYKINQCMLLLALPLGGGGGGGRGLDTVSCGNSSFNMGCGHP